MSHSDDLKLFLEVALQNYTPYVQVSEKTALIKPNFYGNIVLADSPTLGEMNSYLKSNKEKWKIKLSSISKADIEGMIGDLLDTVKKYNRRALRYQNLTKRDTSEDYVDLDVEAVISSFASHGESTFLHWDGTNLFVTQNTNHRVRKYTEDGSFNSVIGTSGTGDGQFNSPLGVFVYNDEIYISDYNNNRVQVFNASNVYQRQWACPGPRGIFVYDNEVFVVNGTNLCIQVYDTNGDAIRQFGSSGSGNGQFSGGIWDVHVHDDKVYVSDCGIGLGIDRQRLQVFSLTGTYEAKISIPTARCIHIHNDLIYVSSYSQNVHVLDLDLNILRTIELSLNFGITNTNTHLYILNNFSGEVFKLNRFTPMEHTISIEDDIGKVTSLKYVADDDYSDYRVFVKASSAPKFHKLDSAEALIESKTGELVTGSTNIYFVSFDVSNNDIILINNYPMGIDISVTEVYAQPFELYPFPVGLVNLKLYNHSVGDMIWNNRYHRVLELEMEWWS